MIFMLDGNILDELVLDEATRVLVSHLAGSGRARFLMSRTARSEVAVGPHLDLLDALPIEIVPNTVPLPGLMAAGDYLGSADHYFAHRGDSVKGTNDALISAAAEFHADCVVSEDRRLVHRHPGAGAVKSTALNYCGFVDKLRELADGL